MAEFNVSFDCDNAAFDEIPNLEISNILRDVADKIEENNFSAYSQFTDLIRDSNGNTIGRFEWKK